MIPGGLFSPEGLRDDDGFEDHVGAVHLAGRRESFRGLLGLVHDGHLSHGIHHRITRLRFDTNEPFPQGFLF